MNTFSIGDVVSLASNPEVKMTVTAYIASDLQALTAEEIKLLSETEKYQWQLGVPCHWFDGRKLQRGLFDLDTLKPV